VPGWAESSAFLDHHGPNIVESHSSYNKVVVLDPPTLIIVEEQLPVLREHDPFSNSQFFNRDERHSATYVDEIVP